jgi:hypothetical protein
VIRARPTAAVLLLAAGSIAAVAAIGAAPREEVRETFRRVLAAPEATARMIIERSDPFGGSPSRESGRLWLLPGRGLRYRSSEKGGQELVIDKAREVFLLYSPSEPMVYRAPYARAPARLRRLIAEPERFLSADLAATAERRPVRGGMRDGFRIRSGSLGDSLPEVSVWLARDARSGLPHWVTVSSPTDTVWIEFRDWSLAKAARPSDLILSAPPGTPEAPLDPRELLERGGGRESH